MKNIVRLLQVAALAVVVMGISKPAAAQVELKSYRFGYQFTNFGCDGCDSLNMPLGFYGDISGTIGPKLPMLDWLGQVTYGRKGEDNGSFNLLTFGGGVRYWFPTMSKANKFYAQGLILVAHSTDKIDDITIAGVTIPGGSFSSNDPGFEASVALDHPMQNGWTATAGAGIQLISSSSTGHAFVVRVGLAHDIKK